MSSTNKLYSRLRTYIAKFLLSFCGIASFGVVTILALTLLSFTTIFGANDASATSATGSTSNSVSVGISSSIAIRLLDSTASTDITRLDFNLTPTAPGTSFNPSISQGTERTVVDVATSNPTGYKLYMQSNYLDSSSNYTTDLVHTTNGTPDVDIADTIPTSTSASTLYWNYTNPMTSSATVIPAHGNPDKLDQYYDATNSRQTPVDINVSVDTTIVSGTYQNQLLFSAVGNPATLDYSVTYNMNGGTPQIAKQEATVAAGTYSFTIPDTVPTKTDYQFNSWQISIPAGTGTTATCSNNNTSNTTTCHPGDTITIAFGIDSDGDFHGDVNLIAQYDATYTYTVTYDCNGGSGCPADSSYGPTVDTSYNYTIPAATITKTGNVFTGFTGPDSQSYNTGDTATISSSSPDLTLTANFSLNTCPIVYNSNAPSGATATGSTASSSMTYGSDATLTSNGYAITGYQFAGWAESDSGSVVFSDGGTISGTTYCTSNGTAKTLYAKWNKLFTYTLNLNTNDGTTNKQVLNYPASGGTTDTSHTFTNLNSQAPTRTGYTFKGWATSSTGTSYVTSYTLSSSSASSTATSAGFPVTGNLYAIWEKIPDITTITYMQEMTSDICATSAIGDSNTLTDTRDNKKYTVKKLKDNKCWMTTDLQITGKRTLTPDDSDVISNTTWSPQSAPSVGCNYHSSCYGTYNGNNGEGWGTFYYYNYKAATAGQDPVNGNASISICPKGWKLPTSNESNSDFVALKAAYNSWQLMQSSDGPNFDRNGYFDSSTMEDFGRIAAYMSSYSPGSKYYDYYMYYFRLDGNYSVDPKATGTYYGGPDKSSSISVRCLAR